MRNNSTSEEFFSLMLSKTQHNIELRAIENGRVGDRLFSRDIQQIEAFIRKNIDRCNLYFGVSTREGSTGTKEGCGELIWLFCDMDLKDYQNDWTEMDRALDSFRYSPSIIINSGNGYHVYWMLKELITDVHSRKGQVEGILKGISTKLKSDMSATDISRVLRVPGSLNHKSSPPKAVEITRFQDSVYSLEDFNEFSMPDNTGGEYKDYADQQIEDFIAKCEFIKYCHENRETLTEPLWFAMLSNVSRVQPRGRDLCHSLSYGHPGYSREETDRKILHCLNDSAPITCAYIKENGFDCGRNCGIKSPIGRFFENKESSDKQMALTHLGDLLDEPDEEVSWVVDGLLPSGGFSIIGAKPKVGKSTFGRNLALCVARGETFLGRNVSKGTVIYYALEEKRSAVKEHFRKMGGMSSDNIYIYTGKAPVDALIQIRTIVETIRPSLIIIDPLFKLTRVKDSNDYAQVTHALDPVLILARETGTHVLCVHHTGKNERQGGDSLLGSTAIFANVDTLIILRRHEPYRTIFTVQRYGDDIEETILHFDKGTGITTLGRSRQEEDISSIKEAILQYLFSQEEPRTEPEINNEVEGRTTLKRKALRELVNEERVAKEGKGGKGDPFKYSCSLVPEGIWEQPEQESKNTITIGNINTYSCSPNLANY